MSSGEGLKSPAAKTVAPDRAIVAIYRLSRYQECILTECRLRKGERDWKEAANRDDTDEGIVVVQPLQGQPTIIQRSLSNHSLRRNIGRKDEGALSLVELYSCRLDRWQVPPQAGLHVAISGLASFQFEYPCQPRRPRKIVYEVV